METKNEVVLSLNNGGRYKQISIRVDYTLGGINYLTGDRSPRGYYAYLIPCSTGEVFRETTLLGKTEESGYKILIEETSRKSQKRLDDLTEITLSKAKHLRDLFQVGEHQKVALLAKTVD